MQPAATADTTATSRWYFTAAKRAASASRVFKDALLVPIPSTYADERRGVKVSKIADSSTANGYSHNSPPKGACLLKPSLHQNQGDSPDGKGYWEVTDTGLVLAFGGAGFYGSMASQTLNKPVVGITATPDGNGYWLVAADGGVFAFGDAGFYGSEGSSRINQPVVTSAVN